MRTTLSGAALVVILSTANPSNAQFQLTPGSIIGEDSVAPSGTTFRLIRWNQAGVVQETLPITNGISGFGTMDGVAILGGQVWVVGTGGRVAQVNLTTGALGNSFAVAAGQVESLANIGSDLLVGYNSGTVIRRYTTAGVLVSTINISSSRDYTALDSDGTRIFAGSNTTGRVDILDLSGNIQSSFNTIANNISGMGYDAGTDTLWVSNGFGNDQIVNYSMTGTVLSQFASGFPFVDGLDVVSIPAPGAVGLLAMAGVIGARRRR